MKTQALDRWFVAKITAKSGASYAFAEWWLRETGSFALKDGGRSNAIATDPAHSVAAPLAVGDFALCRSADGAAGRRWELVPIPVAAGALVSAFLGVTTSITADDTWTDVTGVSVSLNPGEWLLTAHCAALARISALSGGFPARPGEIRARLTRGGGSWLVGPEAVCVQAPVADVECRGTGVIVGRFSHTGSAAETIQLQVKRNSGPTWANAQAFGPDNPSLGNNICCIVATPVGSGPKGDKGDTGSTGPTGPAGTPGANAPDDANAVIGFQVFGP